MNDALIVYWDGSGGVSSGLISMLWATEGIHTVFESEQDLSEGLPSLFDCHQGCMSEGILPQDLTTFHKFQNFFFDIVGSWFISS